MRDRDAGYFLLTEAEREANKLPIGSVRPILSKARHLAKARVTKADWKNLLDANERVWLFNPSTRSLRSKAVRAYIEHGEKVCNLDAYKLKHRDPWYQVKDLRKGIGFLSGMTKLGPWITFRSMRGLAATNTLYVLTAKKHMFADEHAAWALSLLSSPCRQQFNELARRYPDGLPKLEHRRVRKPDDAEDVLVQLNLREVDFNIDQMSVDSVNSSTAGSKKHGA